MPIDSPSSGLPHIEISPSDQRRWNRCQDSAGKGEVATGDNAPVVELIVKAEMSEEKKLATKRNLLAGSAAKAIEPDPVP